MNFKSVLKWLKRKENKPITEKVGKPVVIRLTQKQINVLNNYTIRANKKKKINRAKNKVARESRRGNKK